MKTHHRRALRQDQLLQRRIAQGRGVHRLQAGGRGGTKTGKFRGQVLQPGLFTLGIGLRVLVVEQIDVERPAGQAVGVLDVGFRLFQAVRTQANRTQRARIAHGGGQLRGGGARHGRLNNGVAQAQALHPWGQSGVGHGKSFCREKLTGRPTRCAARHPGTGSERVHVLRPGIVPPRCTPEKYKFYLSDINQIRRNRLLDKCAQLLISELPFCPFLPFSYADLPRYPRRRRSPGR